MAEHLLEVNNLKTLVRPWAWSVKVVVARVLPRFP
jgi:hypothetical protein